MPFANSWLISHGHVFAFGIGFDIILHSLQTAGRCTPSIKDRYGTSKSNKSIGISSHGLVSFIVSSLASVSFFFPVACERVCFELIFIETWKYNQLEMSQKKKSEGISCWTWKQIKPKQIIASNTRLNIDFGNYIYW